MIYQYEALVNRQTTQNNNNNNRKNIYISKGAKMFYKSSSHQILAEVG